jgi:hypothetical protein
MSRLPHCLDNRLTDGSKVIKPYVPAALYPPGRFLVLISVRHRVDPRAIMWLEGLGQLKKIHLIRTWTRGLAWGYSCTYFWSPASWPSLFAPRERAPMPYHSNRRLDGPQSQSGHCREEENLQPLPGIKTRFLSLSIHTQVTSHYSGLSKYFNLKILINI